MSHSVDRVGPGLCSGLTTDVTLADNRLYRPDSLLPLFLPDAFNVADDPTRYSVLPSPYVNMMAENNPYAGIRIGEAKQPGLDDFVDVCLVNPTSMANRKKLFQSLNADVLSLAETSATAIVQREFTLSLKDTPYTIFWGQAVDDKIKTSALRDLKPSRRGENLGTAIMTRVQSRAARIADQSGRFVSCVCCIGAIEVLFVSAYFFPGRTLDAQSRNDILLSHLYDYVAKTSMPFLIAADFNQDIRTLTSWTAFAHLGCEEGFDCATKRLGKTLPPTCRNATKFDSFIIHPLLLNNIATMWVGPEHLFADHSPIYIRFSIDQMNALPPTLFVPADWSILDIDKMVFAEQYERHASRKFLQVHIQSTSNAEEKMFMWSQVIEDALNSTLVVTRQRDPLRFPTPSLPKKFRGRCAPPKFLKPTPSRSVKKDCTNLFNPNGEPTALRSCQKVRQTRRIASLLRQLNKYKLRYDQWVLIPQNIQVQLSSEWSAIQKAQGYGMMWGHWILGFECIPFLPCEVPDIPLLSVMAQITRYDADLAIRQEERNRRHAYKHLIQQDKKDSNGAMTFKALRDPEHKMITGMPCPTRAGARLLRLSKGRVRILIDSDACFAPGSAVFGHVPVSIKAQDRCFVDIIPSEGPLPTKGILEQAKYSQDVSKMAEHFFDFWAPMWLRDTPEEAQDEACWSEVLQETTHDIEPQEPIVVSCRAHEVF